MRRGQNINITGVWKKLIPILTGNFEGFMTSIEEATADVVEIAELELKGGLKVTELLQSHERTWTEQELLLMDEQREILFLRWNIFLMKML